MLTTGSIYQLDPSKVGMTIYLRLTISTT